MITEGKNKYGKLLLITFTIASIVSFVVCYIKVNSQEKMLLPLLPAGFSVLSLLFYENYSNITENIAILLIEGLFFVRLSLLPFLYAFVSNVQLFEGKAGIVSGFDRACWLMIYEFLIVQMVIYCYKHIYFDKFKIVLFSSSINIISALIICLATYIVVLSLFFPQYTDNFKSVFSLTDANFTSIRDGITYNTGTIGRVLKTLYSLGFQIFRILFPAFLINKLYKKDRESKIVKWVLVVTCTLQFVFITSTFAETIVSCLSIILYYIILYPEKKKKTVLFLCVCTAGMMLVYFIVRYFVNTITGLYQKDSGPLLYTAQIINAYFTGVDNVAAIFNIPQGNQREAFTSGLIGAIPFNSTIFGTRGNKLQYFYNAANASYGQIPPTIGAGYYYLGTLFAPLFSGFFVHMSLKYSDRAHECGTSLKFVSTIFCCIVFVLGTVMYCPSVTLSWYFSWGVPMLLITAFTNETE